MLVLPVDASSVKEGRCLGFCDHRPVGRHLLSAWDLLNQLFLAINAKLGSVPPALNWRKNVEGIP